MDAAATRKEAPMSDDEMRLVLIVLHLIAELFRSLRS